MDKLAFATWYGEHSNLVFLIYAAPVVLSWYFYFEPQDIQYHTWLVIAATVAVWYFVTGHLRKICYEFVSRYSRKFAESPLINSATSEYVIDYVDNEILGKLEDLREEKGDYLKLFGPMADLVEGQELLERLGKLKALGFVRITPKKVALTSLGLQAIDNEIFSKKSIVPPQFSQTLARAKMLLDDRNYNGVLDMVNILFEDILRSAIIDNLGVSAEERWAQLKGERRVVHDLDRASLGELLSVCRLLKIVNNGSLEENTVSSFLKLRTPQKHSTGINSDVQQSARSSLDLASVFVRHWFDKK
ncbi:hypothetical protein [Nitrososphaera sp.]|uniref:hypothetical protein n=1 Tax=Nitrososphaera sp. TaxID=1971748 RepID=UPI00317FA2E5